MEALGSPKLKWTSPYTQQGDVLIKKCGEFGVFEKEFLKIPKDSKKITGNLVFKGDTNSHALFGGRFQLYQYENVTFIKVKEATILDHVKELTANEKAEHHAQWIPVGEYFCDGVMEYDHLKEESRRIID